MLREIVVSKREFHVRDKNGERLDVVAQLAGFPGAKPYYSVTCNSGADHDRILAVLPELAPLVDVHLSNESGIPMHFIANLAYHIEEYGGDILQQDLSSIKDLEDMSSKHKVVSFLKDVIFEASTIKSEPKKRELITSKLNDFLAAHNAIEFLMKRVEVANQLLNQPDYTSEDYIPKSSDETTFEGFVAINDIKMTVSTVPNDRAKNMNWWNCDISYNGNSETFKYGIGDALSEVPNLKNVLESLQSDASAAVATFEDFCSDFGYDSDSREAEHIYNGCHANRNKLNDLFGDEKFDFFMDHVSDDGEVLDVKMDADAPSM